MNLAFRNTMERKRSQERSELNLHEVNEKCKLPASLAGGRIKPYKNFIAYGIALLFVGCLLVSGCKKDETTEEENNPNAQLIFKCKIDGEQFVATYLVTHGSSGIITTKGLKVSNGTTPMDGTIRMTLSFGTNSLGELGLGAHEIVGTFFETANDPNNKNKAVFENVVINGTNAYVKKGSTVNVENYYETSSYWQGAKGTFTNVKFYTYTPDLDSVMVTDGEFDVKYVIPGM